MYKNEIKIKNKNNTKNKTKTIQYRKITKPLFYFISIISVTKKI